MCVPVSVCLCPQRPKHVKYLFNIELKLLMSHKTWMQGAELELSGKAAGL